MPENVNERLKVIRAKLEAGNISYDETHELQCLVDTYHVEPHEVELLEAGALSEANLEAYGRMYNNASRLRRAFPIGGKVGLVVLRATPAGKKLVKVLGVRTEFAAEPKNDQPVIEDLSLPAATILDAKRDQVNGAIWTTDPDHMVVTLAIRLHGDHNALTPYHL